MNYEQLKKVQYSGSDNYKKRYINRFESDSCYHLDFNIGDNPAFFIVTNDMLNMVYNIQSYVQKIIKIQSIVPLVAINFFRVSCLIDEMNFTNQYEGVRSSRRELKEALEIFEDNSNTKNVRFLGLVKRYSKMNEELNLSTSQDVRNLYDELILPEIENSEDKPDGQIFRKESVSVMSATNKEAHRGLLPESKIISSIDLALKILKDDNINILIRICIFHYLFGYIHPFYDGNGRISRFISSYLLWNYVDEFLAYRLSYTIVNMRKEYERAFDDCNNVKNKGDITPFILTFLNIILTAAIDLHDHLDDSMQRLNYYHDLEMKTSLSKKEKEVIYIFIQNAMFSFDPLDKATLCQATSLGTTTINNILNDLIKVKMIPIKVRKDKTKNVYSLNLDEFEKFCNENLQK